MNPFASEIECLLATASRMSVEAEFYLAESSATRVTVQDREVEAFNLMAPRGAGVRVVAGGRTGYAFTESFAPQDLEDALTAAHANAELLPPDETAMLESFVGETPALDLYDPDLARVPVDRKIAFALDLDRLAREADERVETVSGVGYGDTTAVVRIASTRGVDRHFRQSLAWAHCMPKLSAGGQNKMYGMHRNARAFGDLDSGLIAREAVERSAERLGSREVASGRYPVVFHPEAFASLLETFSGIFSGKVAQEGKSLLRGKEGQRVAAPVFTLVDDPLRPDGFGSRPFDDEGCPSRTFSLLDGGVFRGFLHNTQTARRLGTATTGHAARAGYAGVLHVSPSNLIIQPGKSSRDDLLTRAPETVFVCELMGLHAGANAISGDFSLQAEGFLCAAGGDRHPIHLFTVSGNIYRLLEAIEALGDDPEMQPSGTSTPSVLVSGLTIGGT